MTRFVYPDFLVVNSSGEAFRQACRECLSRLKGRCNLLLRKHTPLLQLFRHWFYRTSEPEAHSQRNGRSRLSRPSRCEVKVQAVPSTLVRSSSDRGVLVELTQRFT